MEAAVEVHGLMKTYPKQVRALDGLSFTVPSGILFGLLGPNGAGKSTTVKILTTLVRADSGTARVGGWDVDRQRDRVRRVIGVVGQRHSADPQATGRENLTLQGRVHGLRGRDLATQVDGLLDRLDLTSAAGRPVRTYSGGMKRRLDIAMAVVHRPHILFLDEPTTGLDPEIRALIWDDLTRMMHEDGITVLLTTHYMEEADRLASRLAIVDRGRVVVSGTPEELKQGLHGDTLHVRLSGVPAGADVERALAGLRAFGEFGVSGSSLTLHAQNGAHVIPQVIATLEQAGLQVRSTTLTPPSLDEVYLKYAGGPIGGGEERR